MPLDGDVRVYEAETKPDVFSLEELRDWLSEQNQNEAYCYQAIGHCLLAQFLWDHGIDAIVGGTTWFRRGFYEDIHLPRWAVAIAYPSTGNTFGAALARCEAAIAGRQ